MCQTRRRVRGGGAGRCVVGASGGGGGRRLRQGLGRPHCSRFFVGQIDVCWIGSRCRPGHPQTRLRRSSFRADAACSVCRARDGHGVHPKVDRDSRGGRCSGATHRHAVDVRGGAWPPRLGTAAATGTRVARAACEEYFSLKGIVGPHRPHGDPQQLDGSGNARGVSHMTGSVCRCKMDKQDTAGTMREASERVDSAEVVSNRP